MKIKEAACTCGLTEKAIRLYEAKGLIHPPMQEKNGRLFRDYDGDTIHTLHTIGILRRAAFTLEQIKAMQTDPAATPTVLASYCEEVSKQAEQYAILCRTVGALTPDTSMDLYAVAAFLAPTVTPSLPSPDGEEEGTSPSPPPRFRLWDEDITPSEKEEAFARFLKKQARKEVAEALILAIPRGIASLAATVRRKTDEKHPHLRSRLKRAFLPILIAALLLSCLAVGTVRTERIKEQYVREMFWALREASSLLKTVLVTQDYGQIQSERLLNHLVTLGTLLPLAEAYSSPFSSTEPSSSMLLPLTNVLGCRYAVTVNDIPITAILYDGTVSESEWQFLAVLSRELSAVVEPLLDGDGLNIRDGLTLEAMHRALQPFLLRFGELSLSEDSPYRLLCEQ